MKKIIKQAPTIMEKHNALGVYFSIDEGYPAVPYGAIKYFEKYGYLLVKDLYNSGYFKNDYDKILRKNNICSIFSEDYYKCFEEIKNILESVFDTSLYKKSYYDKFFTTSSGNLDYFNQNSNICVRYQLSSNSNKTIVYIETDTNEIHEVNLCNGGALIYKNNIERKVSIKNVGDSNNVIKKLIPNNFFSHQIFFNYDYCSR
jgi:hypothetical protein